MGVNFWIAVKNHHAKSTSLKPGPCHGRFAV
jgi:hypothetical protein